MFDRFNSKIQYNSFPIEWNYMKLTGYIRGVMLNIPTKFERILKKLNICEILGILKKKIDLRTVVYTLYGIEMYEMYQKNKFTLQ